MYATEDRLTPQRALDMKQTEMREIQASYVDFDPELPSIIRFVLYQDWLETVRAWT